MSEPFIGEIKLFGGNFAPAGWALCDGQLLSIAPNSALFSILGTTYGGDGESTFGLPDLRGRVPVHPGSGPGLPPVTQGEKSGSATNTLTIQNMASHTHTATSISTATSASTLRGHNAAGNKNTVVDPMGTGGTSLSSDAGVSSATYSTNDPNADMKTGSVVTTTDVTTETTNANTGNNTPVNNMQPFTAINYIIALLGVFPSAS